MTQTPAHSKVLIRGSQAGWIVVEIAIILLFGLLYSAAFLAEEGLVLRGIDPGNRIEGVEHERLSGILIPVQTGLGLSERAPGIGHLPAWNPYLGTGTPLINNAFFYLFNPLMSLPVLLLGPVQGTKVAIIAGLLVAGINMWLLAKAIGFGRLARVTTAALYMLSGGLIAKFYSGHFQLGLSLVWLPLVLAGFWWTLQTPRRLPPVLTALAFALMFFSGNIYYTLHAMLCCGVMLLVQLFRKDRPPLKPMLGRAAIAAGLTLGLCMIQFLPVWTVRSQVSHDPLVFDLQTGQIASQYSLGQALANLIMPWQAWDQLRNPPANLLVAVDYAYIGPLPFILMISLAFVRQKRWRSMGLIALVLALGMMIWGAGQSFVVNGLYRHIALLSEFRYIGRAHTVAALWWIVLTGVAVDNLWRSVRKRHHALHIPVRLLRVMAVSALLWGMFLIYSLSNNSTRLALVLNNIHLFNALNNLRFTSYLQALDALIGVFVILLVIDTLLLPVDLAFLRRIERSARAIIQIVGTQLAQIALLLLALAALSDALRVNHVLISFDPPGNNFGPLYAATLGTEPFPSIHQPHSPATYDAYYSGIRLWGLDEGWKPQPVDNNLIPDGAPWLLNLPQWAIVSTEYEGGGTYELARQFVEQNNGIRELCVVRDNPIRDDEPCDIETSPGSILYRLPQALPYAFVARADTLQTRADTLTGETALPADAINHALDTITVTATAPEDEQTYYLVVQETHFTGWQAQVDEAPAETFTVGARAPGGSLTGFTAIPMQPGPHQYTLRYYPPGFTAGVLISLITGIAALIYLSGVSLVPRNKKG